MRSIIVFFHGILKFRFNIVKEWVFISPILQRQTGRHCFLCTRLDHFPGHGNQNVPSSAPFHKQTMCYLSSKANDVSALQCHELLLLGMKCSEIIHSATAFLVMQATYIQIVHFYTCLLTFWQSLTQIKHISSQKKTLMNSG